MGRNGLWTPLTGLDGLGSPFSLKDHTYPTQYVLHSVPDGETHQVWMSLSNTHNGADIKAMARIGNSPDSLAIRIPMESVVTVGPFLLVGGPGSTISVGAVTSPGNVWASGFAIVQRTRI